MQTALVNYGVRTAIEILPTGLEPSQFRRGNGANFRSQHGISPERPTLLYVGRVAHEKEHRFLAAYVQKVLGAVPKALFLIVGEGPGASICVRRRRNSRERFRTIRRVISTGEHRLPGTVTGPGDLFVFASRTETQGLVLLEALAQGTPVVSTSTWARATYWKRARAYIVGEDATNLRTRRARCSAIKSLANDSPRWPRTMR